MFFINQLKIFMYIIIKYKLSIIFALIFIMLYKQNIIINKFPSVIMDQEKIINQITLQKNKIITQNESLLKKINAYKKDDLLLIESKARYKYGFIKEGETYYQINQIIN